MKKESKIFLAGHTGLVGSSIHRHLKHRGYTNIIARKYSELDLTRQRDVEDFFEKEKPEYVFLAAAKVGGIMANSEARGEFIYENLMIQNNVIHCSYLHGVKKLLFLGSSCIYPKLCPQPIKEEYLLTGKLEETNEAYAISKITGIKMCQSYNHQYKTNFIAVMPTNLYGPNDNFDLKTSHVLPALIRKFHEAKKDSSSVEVWGSGTPKREFLYVDDLANACVYLMETYDGSDIVNIGTGKDITIRELANLVQNIVGHTGKINWNTSVPDGTPQKLLDVSKLKMLGWEYKTKLRDGIEKTYKSYLEKYCSE